MRGAVDYSGQGGRRQVVYRSLEHDEEEVDEEGRGDQKKTSTSHRNLFIAIGIALALFLLLGAAYLYARSEGKSLSDLFSTAAAESDSPLPSASAPASPVVDLASTSALKISGASSAGSSATPTSRNSASTNTKGLTEGSQTAPTTSQIAMSGPSPSSVSDPTDHSKTETAAQSADTPSTTSSSDETVSYWSKTYTGVGTHFPGAASALACGDVYSSPSNTLFAALCHSLYDNPPGVSDDEVENQNRNPVCGAFVAGRKDLEGKWVGEESSDWVVVGGDGELNCVGTEDVRCHVPRTISVTYNGVTVNGIMIVDRNQGIGPSPCDDGDVDLSDMAYLTLAETEVLSSGLKGVTWTWE